MKGADRFVPAARCQRGRRVLEAASAATGYSVEELLADKHDRRMSKVRYASELAMARLGMTDADISRIVLRDRKTVAYGIARANRLTVADARFALLVGRLQVAAQ